MAESVADQGETRNRDTHKIDRARPMAESAADLSENLTQRTSPGPKSALWGAPEGAARGMSRWFPETAHSPS